MTILIYNWKDIKNPYVGGAEIITFEYARRLVADGHTVTWFCRMVTGLPIEETIDGIRVVRRGSTLLTYWYGYRYYKMLTKKPDLVIDMLNTIAWQTPFYAARQSKVVQYVNQLAKEVWDYQVPWPLAFFGKSFERLQLMPYRHRPVVTYAESTVNDLVAWGYERKQIHQFRLGLDHERYRPGQKATYPLFLQVSRFVANKRPDLTLRAFALVVKDYPEARLALVGNGPFKPVVDRLIKKLKLTDRVLLPAKDILFLKRAAGDLKVKLMQEAWVFVHPSVKEGWGMVITEAAACGTPSIATAVTGQVDAIIDNQTGLLVSPNPTAEVLAAAMCRLIRDAPLRERLARHSVQWAAEFNWDKSYAQFKMALTQATGEAL